jgi:hypothetical protein
MSEREAIESMRPIGEPDWRQRACAVDPSWFLELACGRVRPTGGLRISVLPASNAVRSIAGRGFAAKRLFSPGTSQFLLLKS